MSNFNYVGKETPEDMEVKTMEHKILELLRKEIGVEVGEEFEVYQRGVRQWTCRFDKDGFARIKENGKSVSFDEKWVWKYIADNIDKLEFKKKKFIPKNGDTYWYFSIRNSFGNKVFDVISNVWCGDSFDYGMLALNNVYRTEDEVYKTEDKLSERLDNLLKGENHD